MSDIINQGSENDVENDDRPIVMQPTTGAPPLLRCTSWPNVTKSSRPIERSEYSQRRTAPAAFLQRNIDAPPAATSPVLIEYKGARFMVSDAPHHDNIRHYIAVLRQHKIGHLVRTCERLTYDPSVLSAADVIPHDMVFPDNEPPGIQIIGAWMKLVRQAQKNGTGVGVHCLAGLGRAPSLVVIALIYLGLNNGDAIDLVRTHRRGAISRAQLEYLQQFKRVSSSRIKSELLRKPGSNKNQTLFGEGNAGLKAAGPPWDTKREVQCCRLM